ncbi:SCO family protein [Acidisoma cladoniae]|jgi:cytochrome oxidase Cu insertion factor (SCO1/SenC/PrrC family)|uniref:SCO family protein n=1 Tax=Acidisoma cladoniae TaxID=3040935 RepID=UPI00254DB765|nr:SCO family protein [Acidisoma sp. PAMC 29798]
MIKVLRGVGLALMAVIVIAFAVVSVGGGSLLPKLERMAGLVPDDSGGGTVAGASIGGPFTLTNAATGATVTDQTYRGHWMLVYFGYTFCPDVCPTDLQRIFAAFKLMGPKSDSITPIFVTVDPARDTAPALARYVALFSPRLIGLTGSQTAIDSVVSAYRVYVSKVPGTAGAPYLVNHSAFIYLMNPEGNLAGIYPPDTNAADLARLLGQAVTTPAS